MSSIDYSSSKIWIPQKTSLAQLVSKIHWPRGHWSGLSCHSVLTVWIYAPIWWIRMYHSCRWFLSILFSYMLDYYFTTLILRRFEVWHSGNVMIECISEEAIYYYVAGDFFPTACTVIGYFEVTWHIYLTMKLFPAKMSEKATLQNLWCQRVTVHLLNVSLSFALGNIEILGKQN